MQCIDADRLRWVDERWRAEGAEALAPTEATAEPDAGADEGGRRRVLRRLEVGTAALEPLDCSPKNSVLLLRVTDCV